jgi:gas vesicle protein
MSFSKKDVLDALGIETESTWMTSALAGFGVGCLVGAGIAMMLAPKSGRELRHDLADRGRDLYERGRDFASRSENKMSSSMDPNKGSTPS